MVPLILSMSDSIETLEKRFQSMLCGFDPITTITSLSLDCWQMFGEETLGDPLFSQAGLEHIAGLYSKIPESSHSETRPRPDQISTLKEMSYKIGRYLSGLNEKTALADANDDRTILSHYVFTHFYNVRGEGYPHRLMELFVEKYSVHNQFLQSRLGMTAEQIASVFQRLFLLVSARVNRYLDAYKRIASEITLIRGGLESGELSPNHLRRVIDEMRKKEIDRPFLLTGIDVSGVQLIPRRELAKSFPSPLIRAFLSRFAGRFGQLNAKFQSPTDFNELNARPIIQFGDSLFVPVPGLLFQAPLRTLYYDCIKDGECRSKFEELLGEFQERKTTEFLSRVFGEKSVHHSLRYGDKNQFQADAVVVFDDRLLIIESKSKKLTASARLGSYAEIVSDFGTAILDAYDQASRLKKFIKQTEFVNLVREDGSLLTLKKSDIAATYIVCVTSESYGALQVQITRLLRKERGEQYPWVVSLPDLDVTCDYISNPYMFIQFLERRARFFGKGISSDELDYVAAYLTNGLPFPRDWEKFGSILLSGFAEQFNGEYLKSLGVKYVPLPLRAPDSPEFKHVLQTLQSFGSHGHTSAILVLLDLDEERRRDFVDSINHVTQLTERDGKMHDFTMATDKFGISFLATTSRQDLRDRVVKLGILKKYRHKKRIWLSLGRALDDPRFLVNEFCYLESDWEYDPELEKWAGYLGGNIDERSGH
jgi:hypothetical protein